MQLTDSQQQALESDINILVEAGAGSGKTFLFVERYCQQLCFDSLLKPTNILALTFTKKAAAECLLRIYQKLQSLVPEYPHFQQFFETFNSAPITTFHGFCVSLIRQYSFYINQSPHFIICSENEALFLFKKAIKKTIQVLAEKQSIWLKDYLCVHSESRLEADLINCYYKREMITSYTNTFKSSLTQTSQDLLNMFATCLELYTIYKQEVNYLDFVDLIDAANRLLDIPEIQQTLQQQYKFIMIDECQDTDPSQWELLKKCCNIINPFLDKKLFLVGDSKQCIYRFRGAELHFFGQLNKQFNQQKDTCKVVQLTDNFRSSPTILSSVNPIFKQIFEYQGQQELTFIPLTSTRSLDGQVKCAFLKDSTQDDAEFEFISIWLLTTLKAVPKTHSIAILARERRYCDLLYAYLKAKQIPVQTDKQKGFFAQQIVIDCFQLIKAILQPTDYISWTSLLQSPLFNFSQAEVTELFNDRKITIFETLNSYIESTSEPSAFKDKCGALYKQLCVWDAKKNNVSLTTLLHMVLSTSMAQAYIVSQSNGQYQIDIFLNMLISLEQSSTRSRYDLITQLEFQLINHDSAFELPQQQQVVSIMTIHASKGLEFDSVIVAGCHKPFPFRRSDPTIIDKHFFHCSLGLEEDTVIRKHFFETEKKAIISEEKRLFYVACTRAKQTLLLSGLYHKAESSPYFSYLSFLKSLPDWSTSDNTSTFSINSNTTVSLESMFQALTPINNNQVMQIDSRSDQKERPFMEKTYSSQSLRITDIAKQHQPDVSLHLLQHGFLGSIIHDTLMFVLMSDDSSIDEVQQAAQEHMLFRHLNTNLQKKIEHICNRLSQSMMIKKLKPYHWQFEFPLAYNHNQHTLIGRADAVSSQDHTITLLEIKTDTCNDICDLIKRYELQMQLYVLCLFNTANIHSINALLYSSHLDKLHTQHYNMDDRHVIKQKLQELLIHY